MDTSVLWRQRQFKMGRLAAYIAEHKESGLKALRSISAHFDTPPTQDAGDERVEDRMVCLKG